MQVCVPHVRTGIAYSLIVIRCANRQIPIKLTLLHLIYPTTNNLREDPAMQNRSANLRTRYLVVPIENFEIDYM